MWSKFFIFCCQMVRNYFDDRSSRPSCRTAVETKTKRWIIVPFRCYTGSWRLIFLYIEMLRSIFLFISFWRIVFPSPKCGFYSRTLTFCSILPALPRYLIFIVLQKYEHVCLFFSSYLWLWFLFWCRTIIMKTPLRIVKLKLRIEHWKFFLKCCYFWGVGGGFL